MAISDYWRIGHLARSLSIPPTTLRSAVQRGEIPHQKTACGETLLKQKDVLAWMAAPTPNIRKPRTWEML